MGLNEKFLELWSKKPPVIYHCSTDISKQPLLCWTESSCKAQRSAPEPEECRARVSPYEQKTLCPSYQPNEHRLRTWTVHPPEHQSSTCHRSGHLLLEMAVTAVVSMFLMKWSEHLLSTWETWHRGSHQIHNLLIPRALQPAGSSEWQKHRLSLLVKALYRKQLNVNWTKMELNRYMTP